jgi:hypothetical protein
MSRFSQAVEAEMATGKVKTDLVESWLTEMVELLKRRDLTPLWRATFEALATIHMHGRDVVTALAALQEPSVECVEW